jgi:AcrR family transcriptional regulator
VSLRDDANGAGTSARMMRAAAALFRVQGYARTTTRELASAIGIQSASLYYYMGSKEDLLYQICIDSLEHMLQTVGPAVYAEPDPLERLRVLVRVHLETALADRDKHATMLFEVRALSDVRRAEISGLRRDYQLMVRDVLTDAQAAGVIRRDIEPKHLTLSALSLLNWPIFWYDADGELSVSALSEMLTAVFLDGIVATGERT